MTDETPEQQPPEPTFHLIPSLILFGSAVLFGLVAGLVAGLIYNAL